MLWAMVEGLLLVAMGLTTPDEGSVRMRKNKLSSKDTSKELSCKKAFKSYTKF